MKKINIFNRNIDLPSYRHMPVSRGIVENRHTAEARCPGIAIAMTCPAGDFSSQGDEKHNVCDASFCIRKNRIPAFAGMTAKICGITMIVIAALMAMPAMATQDEIDQKTVTSKYYVDTTKQDKITTDKVLAVDNDGNDDVYVPAIVTTNAAGTELSGDSIGVLSLETFDTVGLNLDDFYEREDLVPTVAALAPAFNGVYDEIDIIVGDIQGDITTINTTIETKQDKMTCAGYLAGHENDEDYCWLYSVASVTTQCLAYNESATSASQCCSGFLQDDANKCGCMASDCSGTSTSMCSNLTHKCVK